MSKIKKWIIILSVILILLIGLLIFVVYQNRGKVIYGIDEPGDDTQYSLDTTVQPVKVRSNYYIAKDCVSRFYSYYMSASDTSIYEGADQSLIKEAQLDNVKALMNMLDEEYINKEGITANNLLTKLGKVNNSTIEITSEYVCEKSNNMFVYFVTGNLINTKSSNVSQFYVVVKVDATNRTFTIIPNEYARKNYNNLKIGGVININVPESIKENDNNTYIFKSVSDNEYIEDLFNQYKLEMIYSPQTVYNKLDSEYKSKKFDNLEQFKQYAKNNETKNTTLRIAKYQKNVNDEYTQYICQDQNNNYYIFKETSIMNYTAILDTYTVDVPEFVSKYNEAKDENKVAYNIKKVFDAINDSDYKYVYNKLDATFKSNYFKTQADFESYVKKNFYTSNEIKYTSCQKNSNTYLYKIIIKDKSSSNQIEKTIVMSLKEGTDFVMSFNVN